MHSVDDNPFLREILLNTSNEREHFIRAKIETSEHRLLSCFACMERQCNWGTKVREWNELDNNPWLILHSFQGMTALCALFIE